MLKDIRKIVTYQEIVNIEGGKQASKTLKLVGVAAVVKNLWIGEGFVEDLYPEINRISPVLGSLLTEKLIELIGSSNEIEAYGTEPTYMLH